ncbi:AAA family ATPase [Actinomyces procaprae]|uniref:cytidylate kinase-like family protein n=1 Tax=Actinomyces procaprae TaxID=2560010 RepID=UPI00144552A6|nr:cytidylate kinase family protein [Actinomyces procaprae]
MSEGAAVGDGRDRAGGGRAHATGAGAAVDDSVARTVLPSRSIRAVAMDSEYCSMGRWISVIAGAATGMQLVEDRELCTLAGGDWLTPEYLARLDRVLSDAAAAEAAAGTHSVAAPAASHGASTVAGATISPELPDGRPLAEVQAALSRAIRAAADAGPCIIHGRAATALLAGRDDVLRVMVYSSDREALRPRAEYDPHFPQLVGATATELDRHIAAQDRARAAYHHAVSPTGWGDLRGYDLALNSGVLSREKCAEVLIEAIAPVRLDAEAAAARVAEFTRTWARS